MLSSTENMVKQVAQDLEDFGLSPNQAKVYVATLWLGITQILKISQLSKVPREEVYRILPQLEKIGLTERILGPPTRIRAIPIEDALSLLVKRVQEKADQKKAELDNKKELFLKNHRLKGKTTLDEEEPRFILIPEKHRLSARTTEMIQRAERQIDIIYSREKLIQFFSICGDVLKESKKTVNIRIITEFSENKSFSTMLDECTRQIPRLNIGYSYDSLVHCIIADSKEILLATSTNKPIGENPKLWTNDSGLVNEMGKYFESIWRKSVKETVV